MTDLSVVIVNFNGMATILETIASIFNLQGVSSSVIVMDDGSTDGSPAAIKERFPAVHVHAERYNTRQVNRLRNRGLALAHAEKILLTDNDVVFDPQCAVALVQAMNADGSVGACLPRLMYLHDPARVYHSGGRIHYVGATTAPGRDVAPESSDQGQRAPDPELAVGGGIALFDRTKLERVGGFDEGYALAWGDDGEMHQRLLLAGYKSLYVPSAVCMHEFKPFDQSRHYRARGQLSNRWRFVLTHYSTRTLILISPAMLLYEVAQALFYLAKGIPLLYLQGWADAIRQLSGILERRRFVQALRAVADRELLVAGPLYVRPAEGPMGRLQSFAVGIMSKMLSAYWALIRPALPKPTPRERQTNA